MDQRANAEPAMCEKCIELDAKIERYRSLVFRISDQITIDRMTDLIERLKAEKAALHPEREPDQ